MNLFIENKDASSLVPGDWFEHGACRGNTEVDFFPTQGQSTREAKEICRTCPVKEPCLEYAMATTTQHGIWGGTSERERRRMRRSRKLAQKPSVSPESTSISPPLTPRSPLSRGRNSS